LKCDKKIECVSSQTEKPETVDPKKQALARRVAVMKLKGTARGPPNILDQDKLYFLARFVHQSTSAISNEKKNDSKVAFFCIPKHTVGRMIDWVATELDIANKNHIDGCDELVFQHADSRLELDNRSSFQKYLDNGSLASGDQLLITYKCPSLGPP